SGLRGHGGRWTATEETMEPTGRIGQAWNSALRFLIGKRLETEAEGEERVGVATGLPILASDNISSSAYATEEAMRVLALAGTAALALTMPIAIAVVFVLAIVVLSESRVIRAYPNGGGSYLVAREPRRDRRTRGRGSAPHRLCADRFSVHGRGCRGDLKLRTRAARPPRRRRSRPHRGARSRQSPRGT